jgi:hypothetical protein
MVLSWCVLQVNNCTVHTHERDEIHSCHLRAVIIMIGTLDWLMFTYVSENWPVLHHYVPEQVHR